MKYMSNPEQYTEAEAEPRHIEAVPSAIAPTRTEAEIQVIEETASDLPKESDETLIMDQSKDIKEHMEDALQSELEAQFDEPHQLQLGKKVLEYAVVNPKNESGENADAEWAVFIGGLGAEKETYKTEMIDLALSGKRTVFVAPSKGVQPESEDTDYFNAWAGALPDPIRNKAGAVAKLLEHLGVTNANIIGHSEGGAVAAALSGMRPQLAKRLLLDNPAGMIGEDTTRELLHRVADEQKTEAPSLEAMWNYAKGLIQFPFWKDIPAIADTDIRPILEHIKKSKQKGGKGPEIILINSNNDHIFKKEDVEAALGEDPLTQYVDRYVVRIDKNAGHQKTGPREGGELFLQVMDDRSLIHQILTEKESLLKDAEGASTKQG